MDMTTNSSVMVNPAVSLICNRVHGRHLREANLLEPDGAAHGAKYATGFTFAGRRTAFAVTILDDGRAGNARRGYSAE